LQACPSFCGAYMLPTGGQLRELTRDLAVNYEPDIGE
jgi:hypothetical protein